MIGWTSAFHADGMYLLDVFSYGHKSRHRTERLAKEVCVKSGDDHSHSAVGQCLNDFYDGIVEELRLVNTDYFYLV